jgi:hypothetical protein
MGGGWIVEVFTHASTVLVCVPSRGGMMRESLEQTGVACFTVPFQHFTLLFLTLRLLNININILTLHVMCGISLRLSW